MHRPTIFLSPIVIYKTGSVEICNTGWGETRITPEELEERVEVTETDIGLMKKDIEEIKININEINKLKVKAD